MTNANEAANDEGSESARSGTGERMSLRLLFFGAAREETGAQELAFRLRAHAKVADALEEIRRRYPGLRRFKGSLLIAVNQEYARPEDELKDGDELAVFPPVSGGSEAAPAEEEDEAKDFFEITTGAIDVGEVARRVVPARCGATVTLDGYARALTKGRRRTLYLIYEAYDSMALAEMRRLGAEARRRFDIAHVGIVHRTGRVEIGETSVVVAVSAPHRRAAFEACEWAIKELKRTVPIWKKEFFEDGEVWIEGEGSNTSDDPV